MAHALPQSYAGVPLPSVDPTLEELATMATLQDIWDWLGASEPLAQALLAEVGGGSSTQLRDIAFIPHEEFAEAVKALQVPVTSAPAAPAAAASPAVAGTSRDVCGFSRPSAGRRAPPGAASATEVFDGVTENPVVGEPVSSNFAMRRMPCWATSSAPPPGATARRSATWPRKAA